jgi:preprotein translocase subunit SecA
MFTTIARKIFGTVNDRILKSIKPVVMQINNLEPAISVLSDAQLAAKTLEFKKLLESGKTPDDILPEAFAVVREAGKRALGMRHFDVQLIGGIILHRGMIAEMKTGEGKTLTETLPMYLNALSGKGVHLVTVNDYLASRDSEWMGKIFRFLGLTVGCITHDMDDSERRDAYACDITYGTNNEYGFDYLRDNMKFSRDEMCQRGFHYAIVDEVDSILIDEARTPLIISGPTEDNSELYYSVDKLVRKLVKEDYEIDEKAKSIILTDAGTEKIEQILKDAGLLAAQSSLYDIDSISLVHHVNQALKAHKLFSNDTDYIVKEGRVIIIDEFTGRMMEGRRYSDGLHQALEAKEGVNIQNENQTLASITFQNYFRLYPKLAGMTGTAMTEVSEFSDIYKLEVVEVPPNLNVARRDEDDEIYRTAAEKYNAIIEVIAECHKKGQPVLVGTISIEKSEYISGLLKKKKIRHNVLNAKQHEREANIVAQAGRLGAVTIATNMAGRGTDIMLGGNLEMLIEENLESGKPQVNNNGLENNNSLILDSGIIDSIKTQIAEEKAKVIEAGGLFVLATERHESRRIDNQLRGRAGRQGDPGVSKFYLSLEDDLMRIFGSERIGGMLQSLGLKEGEAITHPWISRAIAKAQQRVEAHNYEIRKNLLKFDDVMNNQRKVVYEQRTQIMENEDVAQFVKDMRDEVTEEIVSKYIPEKSYPEEWETETLTNEILRIYGIHVPIVEWAKEEGIADPEILKRLDMAIDKIFEEKEQSYGPEIMRMAEKRILILTLDQLWKEHLLGLDHLRQGIGLRAYGQKDPLNEYKREAFEMFGNMMARMQEIITGRIAHMEIGAENQNLGRLAAAPKVTQKMQEGRVDPALVARQPGSVALAQPKKVVRAEDRTPSDPESWGKIARNEVCPCGSGKKYKQCHGKLS